MPTLRPLTTEPGIVALATDTAGKNVDAPSMPSSYAKLALDDVEDGLGADARPECDLTVDKPQALYHRRTLNIAWGTRQELHNPQRTWYELEQSPRNNNRRSRHEWAPPPPNASQGPGRITRPAP